MKATKTPSGRWQVRPVDHYETRNGKRIAVTKCITRDTKAEALRAAYEYRDRKKDSGMTFADALAQYIDAKEPVLSPDTVRAYRGLQKNAYERLNGLKIDGLTSDVLQLWISDYSKKHAPKGVRNAYALAGSALKMFAPGVALSVTLPQKNPPKLYTPTDADVKRLLDAVQGTPLERAILLAAFATLRRGEICALTYADIDGTIVTVNKSMTSKGVLKTAKTPESVRMVNLPPAVVKRLTEEHTQPHAPSDRIVPVLPNSLTRSFERTIAKHHLPTFRFHDLRAYAASMRHALGVPDQYIMQDGGWKTDTTLKQVYRRAMDDKRKEFARLVCNHVDDLIG